MGEMICATGSGYPLSQMEARRYLATLDQTGQHELGYTVEYVVSEQRPLSIEAARAQAILRTHQHMRNFRKGIHLSLSMESLRTFVSKQFLLVALPIGILIRFLIDLSRRLHGPHPRAAQLKSNYNEDDLDSISYADIDMLNSIPREPTHAGYVVVGGSGFVGRYALRRNYRCVYVYCRQLYCSSARLTWGN